MGKIVVCKRCGEEKTHCAKGLCGACYMHQWRAAHPEEAAEIQLRYRVAHREERADYKRRWHAAHPEEAAEYKRRYRATHCDEIVEYQCRYRATHCDEQCEYDRKYHEVHRDERAKYNRQWCKANPDKRRENERCRRARKNGTIVGEIDEAAIYARDKVCIYCSAAEDLTLDHLIPLARGGPHSQDNLAVACRKCNSRKGTKTYEEFVKEELDV